MKYQGDRMESSIGQEMSDDVVNGSHTGLAPEWGVNSRASLFMWILFSTFGDERGGERRSVIYSKSWFVC